MKTSKHFFVATLAMLATSFVNAQETVIVQDISEFQEEIELGYRPQPYTFIQAQGGVGVTFTNVSVTDLLTPTFSLGFGEMFSNGIGVRLHFNGYQSTGGLHLENGSLDKYKFNYINSNLDLMFNLTNIIAKKNNNFFNVYFIGGVGLNYAWHNNELNSKSISNNYKEGIEYMWGGKTSSRKNLYSCNLRAGLLFDFNIHKHWSIGAEFDINTLSDRFNSKYSNSSDFMLTAQVGVTYKFGFKQPRKPVVSVVSAVTEYTDDKSAEEVAAPTPETNINLVEPIREEIFYVISNTTPSQEIVDRVIAWAKKNPGHTVLVESYADKGTGTAEINARISKERAENVAKCLIDAGIPETQITVKSYGDTVQPFAENDKNRCTIISGK